MKKTLKPLLNTCVLALSLLLSWSIQAAESSPETPTKSYSEKGRKSERGSGRNRNRFPFHGEITAVDPANNTFSLHGAKQDRLLKVNQGTEITKAGMSAKLGDAIVGETAGGYCERQPDGSILALKVHFGRKPAGADRSSGKTAPKPTGSQ